MKPCRCRTGITGKRSGANYKKPPLRAARGLGFQITVFDVSAFFASDLNPVYRRAANNVPVLTAAFIAYGVLVAIPMMFNVYLNSAVCLLQFFLCKHL